jgi:hypothetical protein
MRLAILDSGHGFGTKLIFALIRTVSRQPVLDVIKLVRLEIVLDVPIMRAALKH